MHVHFYNVHIYKIMHGTLHVRLNRQPCDLCMTDGINTQFSIKAERERERTVGDSIDLVPQAHPSRQNLGTKSSISMINHCKPTYQLVLIHQLVTINHYQSPIAIHCHHEHYAYVYIYIHTPLRTTNHYNYHNQITNHYPYHNSSNPWDFREPPAPLCGTLSSRC